MVLFGQKSPILHLLVKIFKNKALNKNKKIQQVNLRDPPGKVAVTCRKLQYYSNLHKKTLKTKFDQAPPLTRRELQHQSNSHKKKLLKTKLDLINKWRFPFYIHKPRLVLIRLQLFKWE